MWIVVYIKNMKFYLIFELFLEDLGSLIRPLCSTTDLNIKKVVAEFNFLVRKLRQIDVLRLMQGKMKFYSVLFILVGYWGNLGPKRGLM